MNRNSIFALAVLLGTIVGAGIFGLPYAISKSGVLLGFFYFFILGGAVLVLHLLFGEIVLRTNSKCRIIGYAVKYLGRRAKFLMVLSTFVGFAGSLLAYGIIAGNFLKIISTSFFGESLGLSSFAFTLIFFFGLSFFIYRGMKIVAPAEIFTNAVFFLIVLVVLVLGSSRIDFVNLKLGMAGNSFLPFGVIMFSLVGWTAIPEMCDILKTREEKKNLKKIIILGSVICLLLYLFFSFVVWGVSGTQTSEDGLSGLALFLGGKIILLGALAAVITLIDSFLILGLALKNSLVCDLRFPEKLATFITCGLPIILFLLGLRGFVSVIGFAGTIIGAIDGVIIILIYKKAKNLSDREPEYNLKIPSFLMYVLALIFIIGALAQITYYLT